MTKMTLEDATKLLRKLPGGRVEYRLINFSESEGGRLYRNSGDPRTMPAKEFEALRAQREKDSGLRRLVERWNAEQDARAVAAAEFRAAKLEFLRKLKLLKKNADGKEVVPAYINVADLFEVRIEAFNHEKGTADLFVQTEVKLETLVELLHRASNLNFVGESEP